MRIKCADGPTSVFAAGKITDSMIAGYMWNIFGNMMIPMKQIKKGSVKKMEK